MFACRVFDRSARVWSPRRAPGQEQSASRACRINHRADKFLVDEVVIEDAVCGGNGPRAKNLDARPGNCDIVAIALLCPRLSASTGGASLLGVRLCFQCCIFHLLCQPSGK